MNISSKEKGLVTTVIPATTDATTTSAEIDITGFNALLVSAIIAGTGNWTVSVKGRFDGSGTVMDIYDNNDNQMTTGAITASRMKLFAGLPNLITIIATENSGTATCGVRVQPINF